MVKVPRGEVHGLSIAIALSSARSENVQTRMQSAPTLRVLVISNKGNSKPTIDLMGVGIGFRLIGPDGVLRTFPTDLNDPHRRTDAPPSEQKRTFIVIDAKIDGMALDQRKIESVSLGAGEALFLKLAQFGRVNPNTS
jgi:hypothetical protein